MLNTCFFFKMSDEKGITFSFSDREFAKFAEIVNIK